MNTYLSFDDVPLMLTVEELARLMRVSRNTAYKYVKDGSIKSVVVCKQIRIPKSALLQMFADK